MSIAPRSWRKHALLPVQKNRPARSLARRARTRPTAPDRTVEGTRHLASWKGTARLRVDAGQYREKAVRPIANVRLRRQLPLQRAMHCARGMCEVCYI